VAAQGERPPRETAATEAEISIGVATSPETVMIGEAEAKAVATGGLEVVEGAETAGTAESEVPHALAPAEGRVEIGVACLVPKQIKQNPDRGVMDRSTEDWLWIGFQLVGG